MQLRFHDVDLPLRHPFTISRGSTSVQQALVVELVDGPASGYGEASVNDYYGVTLAGLREVLESLRGEIEGEEPAAEEAFDAGLGWPGRFWRRFDSRLRDCRFAQCALDVAAHDLWGKRLGKPLWQLWGLALDDCAASDYTIGIDAIDRMVAKMQEFPGWPAYKIKLGTDDDVAIVRSLRQHTRAPFRVDANCGWSVGQTLANAEALRTLDVELIEQPLPADDWAGSRRLFAASPIPIFADESCQQESDVRRCVGHFHGVNIKLQKCGGLSPARRMIDEARRAGLRVMVGCMNESTVGISAAAQLLPLVDYADLDGAALLARDVAAGVSIEQGRARFPPEGGCGTRLLEAG